MAKLTKENYEAIATKLLEKGYTVDTVYEALEKTNFRIKFEGEVHSIYASRVIAIMHSLEEVEALDLD